MTSTSTCSTRVGEVSPEDALDQLDQALAARVLTEDPAQFGRYSFAHALIRQALYSDLSVTRRALQHRRVATALEDLAGHDDQRLIAIAHHYLAGAPAGDAEKAVSYARRAGRAAMEALAYEEASDLFEQGLAATTDVDQRGKLLLGLSEAKQASGDAASARRGRLQSGRARPRSRRSRAARARRVALRDIGGGRVRGGVGRRRSCGRRDARGGPSGHQSRGQPTTRSTPRPARRGPVLLLRPPATERPQ